MKEYYELGRGCVCEVETEKNSKGDYNWKDVISCQHHECHSGAVTKLPKAGLLTKLEVTLLKMERGNK
jgi:hypothetical protein